MLQFHKSNNSIQVNKKEDSNNSTIYIVFCTNINNF
jgi:hypothetical protein